MVSVEQNRKMNDEIKLLVKLFFETNKSDEELSEITGISRSTIGRRLTDRERIVALYSEEVFNQIAETRQRNLYEAKLKGARNAAKNPFLKDRNGKFSGSIKELDKVYVTLQDKVLLLTHIAQMYGLSKENIIKYFPFSNINLLITLLPNYVENLDQINSIKMSLNYLSSDVSERTKTSKSR